MAQVFGNPNFVRQGVRAYHINSDEVANAFPRGTVRRGAGGIPILRQEDAMRLSPAQIERIEDIASGTNQEFFIKPVAPAISRGRYLREGESRMGSMPLNETDLRMTNLVSAHEAAMIENPKVLGVLEEKYPDAFTQSKPEKWGGSERDYQRWDAISRYGKEIKASPYDIEDYVMVHGSLPSDGRDAMYAGMDRRKTNKYAAASQWMTDSLSRAMGGVSATPAAEATARRLAGQPTSNNSSSGGNKIISPEIRKAYFAANPGKVASQDAIKAWMQSQGR